MRAQNERIDRVGIVFAATRHSRPKQKRTRGVGPALMTAGITHKENVKTVEIPIRRPNGLCISVPSAM